MQAASNQEGDYVIDVSLGEVVSVNRRFWLFSLPIDMSRNSRKRRVQVAFAADHLGYNGEQKLLPGHRIDSFP